MKRQTPLDSDSEVLSITSALNYPSVINDCIHSLAPIFYFLLPTSGISGNVNSEILVLQFKAIICQCIWAYFIWKSKYQREMECLGLT